MDKNARKCLKNMKNAYKIYCTCLKNNDGEEGIGEGMI